MKSMVAFLSSMVILTLFVHGMAWALNGVFQPDIEQLAYALIFYVVAENSAAVVLD
jgi:hypothetical protein